MEDSKIIELYLERDERAISETDRKYGALCHTIALHILSDEQDAQECVNDTYHRVWKSIPPQMPDNLKCWLGRIVRNIALDLWRKNHRQKRYNGMELILEEMEECIPAGSTVEDRLEELELGRLISEWLRTLSPVDRVLFIKRYWNGEPVKDVAKNLRISANKAAGRLYRLRNSLKEYLEREGVSL
ncbi:MAG: sigma-70 family RNA polymerase sigma factor [Lachnospiraceae bacterium]|nr:sigma-70 family RNA polymerase sigma factor [Lachnospiraceae bacterium]